MPCRRRVEVLRVYDLPDGGAGIGVLVDRIWPRGVRKDALSLHSWRKDVAPSTELRTWYGHQPDRYAEFRRRYTAELATPARAQAVTDLRALAEHGQLLLLTATRDVEHSHAAVLASLLERGS
jgi:uncharacterized protein YeaO (DUF488 family)